MISQEKIEEIKNANDIVDVISEYLTLKKTGKNYKALCPFHVEKTPSFFVSPDKQIFHCFGCGKGGNVFTFIQEQEKLSFIESVKFLADRAGITIEETSSFKNNEREKIFKINEIALNFFIDQLNKAEKVKKYLINRGLNEEIITEFKIGYAPDGNLLYNFLKNKYKKEDLLKTGLFKEDNGYLKDFFKNRIIFPLFNIYGKPIGFAGRVLEEKENTPKYINTKETLIYIKGKNLYNLNNAKKYKTDNIIVVEGYMDVIALYKNGIKNVVASSGTALTTEQARLLKRYVNKVYLMYDMDTAGIEGTIRGGENLIKENLEVYIVDFKDAKDPDEFIKKFGVERLKEKINNSIAFMDFRLNYLKNKVNFDNPYEKEKVLKDLINFISEINSLIIKEELIKKIAEYLNLSEIIIKEYLRKNKSKEIINKDDIETGKIKFTGVELAEKLLIKKIIQSIGGANQTIILQTYVTKRKILGVEYDEFSNEKYKIILQEIEKLFLNNEKDILKKLNILFVEEKETLQIISEFLAEDYEEENLEKSLQIIEDCLKKIKNTKIEYELRVLSEKIKECEKSGEFEKMKEYINKKNEYQKILKGGDEI